MKQNAISLFLSLFVVLSFSVCAVSADADWSADLVVEQTSDVNEEGLVTFRVSVENITSESGIVLAIYFLEYDSNCLELVSWENNYPENWDFSGNNVYGAEDWTGIFSEEDGKATDPYFMYTVMNTSLENGVTADGVLYTDLTFRILDDSVDSYSFDVCDIQFTDINLEVTVERPKQTVTFSGNGNSAVSEPDHGSSEQSDDTSETASDTVTSDNTDEPSGEKKRVTVNITLHDIADNSGACSLEFKLKYNPRLIKFIEYSCILPNNWSIPSDWTEDMTVVEDAQNGTIDFWLVNFEENNGAVKDGSMGFSIVFELNGVEFDSSLLTIEDVHVYTPELIELTDSQYELVIDCTDENGNIYVSNDDEGKITKIIIAVVAVVAVAAAAVTTFLVVQKKKSTANSKVKKH